MNRRDFLRAMTYVSAGFIPLSRNAWALTSTTPATTNKLVVIMLRGAVDGLSVVIPYGDANYYRLRSGIAIPRPGAEGAALDLDGYFGLHPALASLQPFWQQGKLAFVHASGSPDPTRSHFDAQDYMESGTPGRKGTADGWMNRLVGVLPGAGSPTRAISVGEVMPRILRGGYPATNIANGNRASKPTPLDRPKVGEAFAKLYQGDDSLSKAYTESQQTHAEVMTSLEEEMTNANNGAPLPNGFPDDAVRMAKLMRNDAHIQIAFMALGGWDTHANQGAATGQLANHLAPLGQGLAAFAQTLGPVFNDTTVVVMSEFGRTARQNGNNGTDHGHGNVMWLMGGNVVGNKIHGQWPGLDDSALHEDRDLQVTTDFRSVLSQVLGRHLALSDAQLASVFPDMPKGEASLNLMRS